MDKNALTQSALLDAALAATRPLGLKWTVVEGKRAFEPHRVRPRLQLRFGGQKFQYDAEIKRGLSPAILGATLHQLAAHREPALLVADYVTPPMAEDLRRRGVQFIDAAGNAYLRHPPLLLWIKGQRPAQVAWARPDVDRAFRSSGLQALFALLCKPELAGRPYREIAKEAAVSHGTVGWVIPDLLRLGYLAKVDGKRRLLNSERLLNQWVEAYARVLRGKLLLGRYHAEDLGWAREAAARRHGFLLGGEPAAAALTGHLRPGTATFYGERVDPRLLLDYRLRADPNGNVEIRKRFWRFEAERRALTPTLLVYADLLAVGDPRCLEIAEELHARIVNRFV